MAAVPLNDAMWSETGAQLGAAAASVGYRKSPEYQYKAAIEDAYDAAVYFYEHAEEYGIDRQDISVSCGMQCRANLAASVRLYAKAAGQTSFSETDSMYFRFWTVRLIRTAKETGVWKVQMYVFNEMHCKPDKQHCRSYRRFLHRKKESMWVSTGNHLLVQIMTVRNQKDRNSVGSLHDAVSLRGRYAGHPGMPHGFYESGV